MSDAAFVWGGEDDYSAQSPYGLIAALRSRSPVHPVRLPDGHSAWLVLGHAAARQALKDQRLSKDMLAAFERDNDVADEGLPGPAYSRHMLNVDPPDHTRLRRLVARAFTPQRVAALEPAIERIADELLDQLEAIGSETPVDLVSGFAHPLPFQVICELLGVAQSQRAPLHDAFQTLLRPWQGSPPPEAVAASDAIVAALEGMVAAHRAEPSDDLVSVLVTAADNDEALTEQEMASTLFQLIVAGHDTTTSLIGNGIVDLLDHPDQLEYLLRDLAGRMPTAIEELMRFSAPVPHATFRVTTEPLMLDTVEVPAGEVVLVCLASANRDPAAYDRPDELDLSRQPRHVGFGHGIHFCLGAPLARLEARVAMTALLSRFPRVRLAGTREGLRWAHGDGLVLRGLDQLPVYLDSSEHPLSGLPIDKASSRA